MWHFDPSNVKAWLQGRLLPPWPLEGTGMSAVLLSAHAVMELDLELCLQVPFQFSLFIMLVRCSEVRHKMECGADQSTRETRRN